MPLMRTVLAALAATALLATSARADDSPFLWQVKGPKATHYLQGSVHLLPESAAQLPPALEAAYASAQGLVFESDIVALTSADLQTRLLDAAKETGAGGLAARIKPALYEHLQKRTAEWGLPGTLCDNFKAWFCAMTIEQLSAMRAGFSADNGLDLRYFERARGDGKRIAWLEEPDEQLALFAQMPERLGAQFLAATLDELTDASMGPEKLLEIWRNTDVAAMDKLLRDFRAHYPEAYLRLLAKRNEAWLPKLAQFFDDSSGTELVIVGAAHLAGADGLVAGLRQRGFEVKRVPAAATAMPAEPTAPR